MVQVIALWGWVEWIVELGMDFYEAGPWLWGTTILTIAGMWWVYDRQDFQ